MLNGKKGPYLLLAVLTAALFFILGLQYGKKVEKADKTISYILSITPAKKASPTTMPNNTYALFKLESCGVTFLYPENMVATTKDSYGIIQSENNQFIEVSCSTQVPPTSEAQSKQVSIAARSATEYPVIKKVSNRSIEAFEYRIRNPFTNKVVVATVEANLATLVTKSIELTN